MSHTHYEEDEVPNNVEDDLVGAGHVSEKQRLTSEYLKKIEHLPDELYDNEDFDDEAAAAAWHKKDGALGNSGRNWCFTLNHYKDYMENEEEFFTALFPNIKYMVVGREVSKKGTPHLQGFIVFVHERTFGHKNKNGTYHKDSLKGILPQAHWSKMRTSSKVNINYCRKEGNYFEIGQVPTGAGARTDLTGLCEQILSRKLTIDDMYEQYPSYMVRMGRGFTSLFSHISQSRSERPYVAWHWGPTGCGKSKQAELDHGRDNVYRKTSGGLFWNEYRQQTAIVIEEFSLRSRDNPTGWIFEDFLQVLDQYNIPIEVKGGSVKINSPFIYITSSRDPFMYFETQERFSQVLRRLDMIYHRPTDQQCVPQEQYASLYFNPDHPQPKVFSCPIMQRRKEAELMKCAKSVVGSSPIDTQSFHSDEEVKTIRHRI